MGFISHIQPGMRPEKVFGKGETLLKENSNCCVWSRSHFGHGGLLGVTLDVLPLSSAAPRCLISTLTETGEKPFSAVAFPLMIKCCPVVASIVYKLAVASFCCYNWTLAMATALFPLQHHKLETKPNFDRLETILIRGCFFVLFF